MYQIIKIVILSITLFFVDNILYAQNQSSTEKCIDKLINKMTLGEKINMIHGSSSFTSGGVKRLGIPELTMSDGPHGVRMEHGRDWTVDLGVDDACTYLPSCMALAASWNPVLGYSFGKVLGSEAKYRAKDVILGPGVNIIRTPLNGRNFEYLSEDPFLSAQMAVGYINGVQSEGIAACVKHFAANNQEKNRLSINVEMSERALREIYLPAFKAAVTKAKVKTVMGAYNKFRGDFCCENDYLLNSILKGEWDFRGPVISDWGGVHHTLNALNNGVDIEMGTDLTMGVNKDYSKFFMGDTVLVLLKERKISEAIINEKVRRILRVMYETKMISGKRTKGDFNTKQHQQIALKLAEESIVLLKNEQNILPFKNNLKTIAVIGANADRKHAMNGGSSQVKAKYEITPLQGLQNLVGKSTELIYEQGYNTTKGSKADSLLIARAVSAASKAEAVIVVGGWTHAYKENGEDAYDTEAIDKIDLNLPFGQDELIQAILKVNPNVVVVMMGGGPVDMSAWISDTKGVIEAWYPGMEGGNALAKIIFGEVNPSGKLPVTFPKKMEDTPVYQLAEYLGTNGTVHYKDDIFVGYRFYDTYQVEPQFAFGHGLSYTTFDYEDLKITKSSMGINCSFFLKNIGQRAGSEVVQIYIKKKSSEIKRAEKELKAFQKINLRPGEKREIKFKLDADAFQYFNETKKNWTVEDGQYEILVGSSSRDIRIKNEIEMSNL